jgi:hypothetical protein
VERLHGFCFVRNPCECVEGHEASNRKGKEKREIEKLLLVIMPVSIGLLAHSSQEEGKASESLFTVFSPLDLNVFL